MPATRADRAGYGHRQDGPPGPYPPEDLPPMGPHPRPGGGRKPPRQRSAAGRAVIGVVVVLVLAAVGVAAWSVSRNLHHSATPAPTGTHSPPQSAAAAAVPLQPVSAAVYNPLGSSGDDDPADAPKAIDGTASTFWHTSYYLGHPAFGNLKKGTGLILDMGRPVRLSQVAVQFGASCCAHVVIEVGNSSTVSTAALGTFTPVQSSSAAHGSTTFDVTRQVTGRYVLIWITDLPPLAGSSDKYEAMIYDVTVHGVPARQSG